MIKLAKTKSKPERRLDLDFMRAFIVLGLILFHTAKIFDMLSFYVKNAKTSTTLMALVGFASQWGMPLLFFVAGAAAWFSLRSKSGWEFLFARFKRLIVPFLFGLAVIVPPQVYYYLKSNPEYHDSYWQFYPSFFKVVFRFSFPRFIRPDPAVGVFQTAHLWYLYYLFIFTLLALPLFLYLKKPQGQRFRQKLGDFFALPLAVFLLAVPVILVELFLNLGETEGWNRYSFAVYLIYGYIFATEPGFKQAVSRYATMALLAGTLTLAAFFWVSIVTWQAGTDPSHGFAFTAVLWRSLKGLCSWLWVVAILGFGERVKDHLRSRRSVEPYFVNSNEIEQKEKKAQQNRGKSLEAIFRYINEAVLPIYILHQTVIVIIGFYVVRWQASVAVKYLFICLATVVISFLLYDVLVRRTNFTRFLFGMKLKT